MNRQVTAPELNPSAAGQPDDPIRDQISAFLDGELPAPELDLLLKRLERESELKNTVARYALIGEAARQGAPSPISRHFLTRTVAAVAEEHEESAAALRRAQTLQALRKTGTWFGGFAIAATVATLAILGVQRVQLQLPGAPVQGTVDVADTKSSETVVIGTGSLGEAPSYTVPTPASGNSEKTPTQLADYIVAHSDFPLGRPSVLSGGLTEEPVNTEGATETESKEGEAVSTENRATTPAPSEVKKPLKASQP